MPTEKQALFSQLMVAAMLLECIHGRLFKGSTAEHQLILENLHLSLRHADIALRDMRKLLEKPAEPTSVCY